MNLAAPDLHGMAPGGISGLPGGHLVEVDGQTYWRIEYVERLGGGLIYTPMKSTTLATDSFVPLTATPQTESIDAEWQRVIFDEPYNPATEPSCFWQVRVTLP